MNQQTEPGLHFSSDFYFRLTNWTAGVVLWENCAKHPGRPRYALQLFALCSSSQNLSLQWKVYCRITFTALCVPVVYVLYNKAHGFRAFDWLGAIQTRFRSGSDNLPAMGGADRVELGSGSAQRGHLTRCQRPERPPGFSRPLDFTQKGVTPSLRPEWPPWQTCWIFNGVLSKMAEGGLSKS